MGHGLKQLALPPDKGLDAPSESVDRGGERLHGCSDGGHADREIIIAHRTDRRLDVAVRMLEPILLTFMAAVVLFVVLALLLPILQSSSLV